MPADRLQPPHPRPAPQARILDILGWWDSVDLALCPEDAGRGRPYPDLILSAALRLGIDDVREIAVCGDTDLILREAPPLGATVTADHR